MSLVIDSLKADTGTHAHAHTQTHTPTHTYTHTHTCTKTRIATDVLHRSNFAWLKMFFYGKSYS